MSFLVRLFPLFLMIAYFQQTFSQDSDWEIIDGSRIKAISIYFIHWYATSPTRLSAEDVRKLYHAKIILKQTFSLKPVLKLLDIKNFRYNIDQKMGKDIRMVIDLLLGDGTTITLVATRFHLCTFDFLWSHPIDDDFRNAFLYLFCLDKSDD